MSDIFEWAKNNIVWAGTSNTNYSYREGQKPMAIVNHISEGSIDSLLNWFNNEENTGSSANFGVAKDGRIFQFVDIAHRAWANGKIAEPTSDLVIKMGSMNPNKYTVSIEHEGVYAETNGRLTKAQLESTAKLQEYIIAFCKRDFNVTILPDRNHILGHCEIDSITRSMCPGPEFPYKKIIDRLTHTESDLPFSDIDGHWAEASIVRGNEIGIADGYPDGTYRPDNPITRAEHISDMVQMYDTVAKLLAKLAEYTHSEDS